LAHEPLPYITGHKEFYGLDLRCGPEALIPRPETELLVELTVKWLGGCGSLRAAPVVADVGTGSGAIAVALAHHTYSARLVAIDRSMAAIGLAHRNANLQRVVGRIDFIHGSL
jgi:release factor glutamine methyltransferase